MPSPPHVVAATTGAGWGTLAAAVASAFAAVAALGVSVTQFVLSGSRPKVRATSALFTGPGGSWTAAATVTNRGRTELHVTGAGFGFKETNQIMAGNVLVNGTSFPAVVRPGQELTWYYQPEPMVAAIVHERRIIMQVHAYADVPSKRKRCWSRRPVDVKVLADTNAM